MSTTIDTPDVDALIDQVYRFASTDEGFARKDSAANTLREIYRTLTEERDEAIADDAEQSELFIAAHAECASLQAENKRLQNVIANIEGSFNFAVPTREDNQR